MSLTDLLLASKSEAQEIADSEYPLGKWSGIDTKGIDVISYSYLYCLLFGQEWESKVVDKFPIVSAATDEGPWVAAFPDDLKCKLSVIQIHESDAIVKIWSESDELRHFGSGEIKSLFEHMCNLSREAYSKGKELFIWMSL